MNIANTLNHDETIEYQLKLSYVPFFIGIAFAAAFAIYGLTKMNTPSSWWGYLMFFFAFLVLFYSLTLLEYILSTKVCVTNKRIILRTGVLNTKHSDIPRNQISAISVSQSLIGKLFNYAEISIESSAHYTVNSAKYIKRPLEFKQKFNLHDN